MRSLFLLVALAACGRNPTAPAAPVTPTKVCPPGQAPVVTTVIVSRVSNGVTVWADTSHPVACVQVSR